MKRKRKKSGLPFAQLFRWVMQTAAFRDLSPGARSTYIAVKSRYNGSNNGALVVSTRTLGLELNMHQSSAARFLRELEEHGFLVRQARSSFDQKRLATEWALTEARNDVTSELPSKAFLRWVKVDAAETPRSKVVRGPTQGKPKQSSTRLIEVDDIVSEPKLASQATQPELAHEKLPVAPVNAIVSPVKRRAPLHPAKTSASSTNETVRALPAPFQSHGSDTYTSAPSGQAPEINLTPLVSRIRAAISRLAQDQRSQEWCTPIAMELAESFLNGQLTDPLAAAVLRTFPGSRPQVSNQEIEDAVRSYLEAARQRDLAEAANNKGGS